MDNIRNTSFKSCFQVMSKLDYPRSRKYTLRIKDPSFVTIFHEGDTFYFGRVQVQAIHCDPTNALQMDKITSQTLVKKMQTNCWRIGKMSTPLHVGIKKADQEINTVDPVNGKFKINYIELRLF